MRPANYQVRALHVLNRLTRIAARDKVVVSEAVAQVDAELAKAMIAHGLLAPASKASSSGHLAVTMTAAGASLAVLGDE